MCTCSGRPLSSLISSASGSELFPPGSNFVFKRVTSSSRFKDSNKDLTTQIEEGESLSHVVTAFSSGDSIKVWVPKFKFSFGYAELSTNAECSGTKTVALGFKVLSISEDCSEVLVISEELSVLSATVCSQDKSVDSSVNNSDAWTPVRC